MASSITCTHFCLLLSAFFSTVVFGFVLLFAAVIMPGIADLDDAEYLRAFQVMDGTIQNNQPIFVTVWMGSIAAIASTMVLTIRQGKQSGLSFALAMALFFVGQVITFAGNIPLNNNIHAMDISEMDESSLSQARGYFEDPWKRWNNIRTALFGIVSAYLLWVLLHEDRPQKSRNTEDSLLVNAHTDIPRYT